MPALDLIEFWGATTRSSCYNQRLRAVWYCMIWKLCLRWVYLDSRVGRNERRQLKGRAESIKRDSRSEAENAWQFVFSQFLSKDSNPTQIIIGASYLKLLPLYELTSSDGMNTVVEIKISPLASQARAVFICHEHACDGRYICGSRFYQD